MELEQLYLPPSKTIKLQELIVKSIQASQCTFKVYKVVNMDTIQTQFMQYSVRIPPPYVGESITNTLKLTSSGIVPLPDQGYNSLTGTSMTYFTSGFIYDLKDV